MRPVWLAFLLLASLPAFSQAANSSHGDGMISGTVLDASGEPFKGVQVCTYMQGAPSGSTESRGACSATSDEAGQFHIDHVEMGVITIEAIKPEDGYVAFAGTSVTKQVTLTPTQLSATVVLKLGPKAGVLIPRVKDRLTGKPIVDFEVAWRIFDSDEAAGDYSGGQHVGHGTKNAIVPPEKYLVLTISARGYKKWIYCDPSDPSKPAFLRLQSGEEKELVVELEPKAPADH